MQSIEKTMILKAIRAAKTAGFSVTGVNDGGDFVPCRTEEETLSAVDSVDDSVIYLKKEAKGDEPERGASLVVVLGNGEDCLADHSLTPGFAEAMDTVF